MTNETLKGEEKQTVIPIYYIQTMKRNYVA